MDKKDTFSKENLDAGKEKAKAAAGKVNEKIKGLAFRGMLENKVKPETRAKFPILDKLIPITNYVACGVAVLLVVVVVSACFGRGGGGGSSSGGSSSGGGKAAPASDFTYNLNEARDGVIIGGYTGNGGRVVIPETIEGFPVVELGHGAFRGLYDNGNIGSGYNITAVVIPASVKYIHSSCFQKIEKLTSVTFLGTGVELANLAFWNNLNLSELIMPEGDNVLTPAGSGMAFSGCNKLPLAVRAKLVSWGFMEP